MRCRYCSTRWRELVRPSCIAFCMSGIVASTTLKEAVDAGVELLVVQAAMAVARMIAAARCFMAAMITLRLAFRPPAASGTLAQGEARCASESKHLRVLHN